MKAASHVHEYLARACVYVTGGRLVDSRQRSTQTEIWRSYGNFALVENRRNFPSYISAARKTHRKLREFK